MASQNKANPSPVASSAKNPSSKLSLSPTPKKQPNILWMDLSSKLASNDKLTSNEHKKHLKNNLCLYCSAGDYKLNSCSKKQTMVSSKGCGASVAASEKSLEKWRATSRTLHRLRAMLKLSCAATSPIQLNASTLCFSYFSLDLWSGSS